METKKKILFSFERRKGVSQKIKLKKKSGKRRKGIPNRKQKGQI